jgi:hypothetical protein
MGGIKIFECKICKQIYENNVKGINRFFGNRKEVRFHLTKEHHIKGRKNKSNLKKKDFGDSEITQNCILYKEY